MTQLLSKSEGQPSYRKKKQPTLADRETEESAEGRDEEGGGPQKQGVHSSVAGEGKEKQDDDGQE